MLIMHQDLHLFLYGIQSLKLHTHTHKAERRACGETISQRIEDHPDFLDFILFSDEANLNLSDHVNKQNTVCAFSLKLSPMNINIVS